MKKRLFSLLLCLLVILTLLPVSAQAAKTPLTITKQPANKITAIGKTVSTTVNATGDGLKYQWYVQNPGQSRFYKSSITSRTYSYTMTAEKSGRQV